MIRPLALLSLAAVTLAAAPVPPGWKLVRQDESPRVFAISAPEKTNLNIHSVVLACEDIDDRRSLQLQIYPTNAAPILPLGVARKEMKEEPRAEIVIDGRTFPIQLGFGGDYAVLLDREEDGLPVLSAPLVEALENGRTMLLRVDLVRERGGNPPAFDGELEVDLTAGEGHEALVAVRQGCERK